MAVLRWSFLWPLSLGCGLLVGLCVYAAVSLVRQQATVTGALREPVASRRSATELEECARDILALVHGRVESVAPLNDRAVGHLAEVRRHSDHAAEQELSVRLDAAFADYLARWKAVPPADRPGHEAAVREATRPLEADLVPACEALEQFNDGLIEDAIPAQERALRQLTWGIAGVCGLGGVAGLVLGFGVARALSRSIRRLQVQIHDAAGKLGPDLGTVVFTPDGDLGGLHEQVERLAGRIEDIVARLQEREREVLRAEQMAAVGQLAAGVAHEVRNPLTSIKMLAQAGLEADGLSDDDLRVIESEVRRTEKSLQAFLDFARPPRPHRRPVSLLPLLVDVLGLIRGRAEKQRVAVRLDAPPGDVTVTADADQLRQVFVNLALNALDAMPTGGGLTVAVRPAGGAVAVSLADTGPGIRADILPRLFRPFVSGKETGVGLGLVISARIAEDHGGTITAANRPGDGAEFVVTLPTTEG